MSFLYACVVDLYHFLRIGGNLFFFLELVSCGEGGGELAMRPVMVAHRTNLGTEAEPQQIVAQRLLSCLQYPVP